MSRHDALVDSMMRTLSGEAPPTRREQRYHEREQRRTKRKLLKFAVERKRAWLEEHYGTGASPAPP